MSQKPLLLYDGECPLCRRSVAWVRRKDTGNRIDAMPYQEAPSPPMTPALRAACTREVHVLLPGGGAVRDGRAVLYILDLLGYHVIARMLGLPPIVWAVALGYRIVSANRGWLGPLLFGRRG